MEKLLLFDLDDTLLRSDKSISEYTLDVLNKSRQCGYIIGISTSRSEHNCLKYIGELNPDMLITSGGALVKYKGEHILKESFSVGRIKEMIEKARSVCGNDVEITVDTISDHFWNYKIDPLTIDSNWGGSHYTDFNDFNEEALKMCVEIFDENSASQLVSDFSDCDSLKYYDGCWYKFTKKGVNKENAIRYLCKICNISTENIIAFGDDIADLEMLRLAGTGVAMGNAVEDVKLAADIVIGTNDEDGAAKYIESIL